MEENIIKLSEYGAVRTCKIIDNSIVTIALTDDFSTKNSMNLMGCVVQMFSEFPVIETCICEDNFALIILKKS